MAVDENQLGEQTTTQPTSWADRLQVVLGEIVQPPCESVEKYLLPATHPEVIAALNARTPCTATLDPDSKWSDKHIEIFAEAEIEWPVSNVPSSVQACELAVNRCPERPIAQTF